MQTKSYIIEGQNFTNFAEFIQEFNRVFTDIGADWEGNLDAFNDYLTWPLDTDDHYDLIWLHSAESRQRLGYSEMVAWLQERVQHRHSTNVAYFTTRLRAAEKQQGPTMFDLLIEIIQGHSEIELRLE